MTVLVVGAGPTGLTLACLLQRQGVDVRLIDRLAGPPPLAKAMVVWSRSLEILDQLGLAETARGDALPLRAAHYLDTGRAVAQVTTDSLNGTAWQPIILPQHRLEAILRAEFEDRGGCVEWSTEFLSARQLDHSAVAELRSGASRVHGEYSAIVGCDGWRSAVRQAADIAWHELAPYEEVFQLGDAVIETNLARTGAYHFLGARGVVVMLPMPNDLWRVAGYLDGSRPTTGPDVDVLNRLLRECGHRESTVRAIEWASLFTVKRRLAERFATGRIVVAGDAAHLHSPAGGQGLNTGMQDAQNLAWKLALVDRGQSGPALLDSYTAERRPIAANILRMTQLQDNFVFGARARASRALRNGALRLGSRSGLLEAKLIPDLAQLFVNYRDSPLTQGSAPRHSLYRPGRHLPYLPQFGGSPHELATLVRDKPSIVVVPDDNGVIDTAAVMRAAGPAGSALDLVRLPASLPDLVPAPRGGYLLGVRPDGFVGLRCKPGQAATIASWLGALGLSADTANQHVTPQLLEVT